MTTTEIETVANKMDKVVGDMMQPLWDKINILDKQNKELMQLLRDKGIDFSHIIS